MRQLMQARVFAFTDVHPVVRSDFHAALASISATASPAARNGYRVSVGAERGLEPFHPLDGMNVRCATPIIDDLIIRQKYRAS